MSSVAKTIAAIENMWQSAFPEIPWTKQALRVRVDPSFLSSKFQLIFDGNYQTLKIHAEVAGNLGGHARGQLPNPLFEATTPPDQSSLLLNLIQVKSSDLSFITFESGAEKFAFHNLVCLQHDDLTGQWVVIYNSLDRQKELILAIKKILQACQDPVREDLYAFFQLLIKRDFNGALRAIARLAVAPILGAAFVVFLPVIGIGAVCYGVGAKIKHLVLELPDRDALRLLGDV